MIIKCKRDESLNTFDVRSELYFIIIQRKFDIRGYLCQRGLHKQEIKVQTMFQYSKPSSAYVLFVILHRTSALINDIEISIEFR